MAAVRETHSNCIFDDPVYAEIQRDLGSFPTVLKDLFPNGGVAAVFADWAQLFDLFKRSWVYLKPIHERVVTWDPNHPETQRIRTLWMQIFTAFHYQALDARENAIASFVLLIKCLARHIDKEHQAPSVDADETDEKQNGSKAPLLSASSAEDLARDASAILFEDPTYASIRRAFQGYINQCTAKLDDPDLLESWPKLCALFHELNIVSIYDKIDAWNPNRPETQKVKALWMQIFTAFRRHNVDRREHVIAAFFVLLLQMTEHDVLEESSRPFSPDAPRPATPPTSPVELAPKTAVEDGVDEA